MILICSFVSIILYLYGNKGYIDSMFCVGLILLGLWELVEMSERGFVSMS